jgi:hypothetical protein
MYIFRLLLGFYRRLLSVFYGKNNNVTLSIGKLCKISKFEFELNKGDIVHPCVRYAEKKFKGYNWWLIYTPYYNANADLENPILCYGTSETDEAPLTWTVYSEIIGKPVTGYNSDPTMFFDKDKLNVFWRENATPRTQGDSLHRATYGCVISETDRCDIENPVLCEKSVFEDKEVSPAIVKLSGAFNAYAMHMRFSNPKLHSSNIIINKITKLLLRVFSILEIYSEQKSYGIAIWKSNSLNEPFAYYKTTKIKNSNKLYKPWHLDIFEYENRLFAVIQTTQCNADICLAVSDDSENFVMYSKPLITNASINKLGIYKPTAIIHKGVFYLYYTAQNKDNRSLNLMYLTSISFSELLKKLY